MLLSVLYKDTNDLIGISVIWETYSPIPGRPAPESSGSEKICYPFHIGNTLITLFEFFPARSRTIRNAI
jgi:hypothetical protein